MRVASFCASAHSLSRCACEKLSLFYSFGCTHNKSTRRAGVFMAKAHTTTISTTTEPVALSLLLSLLDDETASAARAS